MNRRHRVLTALLLVVTILNIVGFALLFMPRGLDAAAALGVLRWAASWATPEAIGEAWRWWEGSSP